MKLAKRTQQISESEGIGEIHVSEHLRFEQIPLVKYNGPGQALQVPCNLPGRQSGQMFSIVPEIEGQGVEGSFAAAWAHSHIADGQTSSVYAAKSQIVWKVGAVLRGSASDQLITKVRKLLSQSLGESFRCILMTTQ
jgi:hypothetical protein